IIFSLLVECDPNQNSCSPNAECSVNVLTMKFQCQCKPGLQWTLTISLPHTPFSPQDSTVTEFGAPWTKRPTVAERTTATEMRPVLWIRTLSATTADATPVGIWFTGN